MVEYDWYGESEFNQYAYLKNLQGDVTHIISVDDDTVITSYVYDPWGNPTVFGDEEIAAINPCSYRGYYFDEETGWYYLQSRYYNPETGRFLNADDARLMPLGFIEFGNIFLYCSNLYVVGSDSTGYYYISLQKLINILTVVLCFHLTAVTIITIGIAHLKKVITAKLTKLGAKLGSFWGPAVSAIVSLSFGILGLSVGKN